MIGELDTIPTNHLRELRWGIWRIDYLTLQQQQQQKQQQQQHNNNNLYSPYLGTKEEQSSPDNGEMFQKNIHPLKCSHHAI